MKAAAFSTVSCLLASAIVLGHVVVATAGAADSRRVSEQVAVTEIPGVVAAGVTWTLAWQGTDNADGLVGTADGGLLFAQEQPNRVSKLDRNDRQSVFLTDTHGAGSVAIDSNGRILAVERTCTDPGRPATAPPCAEPTAVSVLAPARKVLADNFEGKPLGRVNDLVVDRKGGVYFTSGGAFYANRDGRVTSLGENIRANGIMLSPDEKTVYVTNGAVILAFDIQPDGAVTNRRDFAMLEAGGSGDGLADRRCRPSLRHVRSGRPGVQPGGQVSRCDPGAEKRHQRRLFRARQERALCRRQRRCSGRTAGSSTTPEGVRNNAKTIYKLPMRAQGFKGRAK